MEQENLKKEYKNIIQSTIYLAIAMFLAGTLFGCFVIFVTHKDAIRHYNSCQEQSLLDSLAKMGDEKQWYIKEDAFGKIRVVEMSNNEIDSLKVK